MLWYHWGVCKAPPVVLRGCMQLSAVCVCACVCVQHWPEAWLPGAKNDILGEVTMDDQVTREQTW